jgi:ATP-dependent helicase STH1/SNF2
MTVPPNIQQAIRVQNQAIPELEKLLAGQDVSSRVVDGVVKIQKAGEDAVKDEDGDEVMNEEDLPKGPFLEDDINSGIYPYNAYKHPFTNLRFTTGADPQKFSTKLQRLLVPSAMPTGLDAHQIINERDRFVEARIQQRIRELEAMPSTMGDGGFESVLDQTADTNKENDSLMGPPTSKLEPGTTLHSLINPSPNAHGKLRAMIELKSLKVLDKQRAMRALVAERLTHGSLLPLNRADFRRVRKPTIRDARMTEQMERKQRTDRERRAKHKHVEQLSVITSHGRDLLAVNRAAQDRVLKLGRAVLQFHAHTEREEQKRIERLAKERLKALKADDEEAYMKLIDTAKDTRITHLLKQTDSYLDSLAQAVVAQQNEGQREEHFFFETEEGPANEATFGAQIASDDIVGDKSRVDYYAVAHKISERVTRQPILLVGGTLKEYQLKGLQWMVSLYNNRLNGILADEMVHTFFSPLMVSCLLNLSCFQGLGKTIQTISLIAFLIESKKQRGPYLVIVPLSTMTNWSGEFAKWAPQIKAVSYKGNPAQRRILQGELRVGHFQVLLTTYEYIIKDRPVLSKIKWVHMIIGELWVFITRTSCF